MWSAILATAIGLFSFVFYCHPVFSREDSGARNFVVITDLEPDDRVALSLLAYFIQNDRLGLVGSALMNSERKRVLIERVLRDYGFFQTGVLRGSGGFPNDYPDIHSTRPARQYQNEGHDILSESRLDNLSRAPRDGRPFQEGLKVYLEENENVEIVVMSSPHDLLAVLQEFPDLIKKIKIIHVMGGWIEVKTDAAGEDGGPTKLTSRIFRATFNHNMGHLSSAQLFALNGKVRMRLYSSHMIKDLFRGGSINRNNFPEVLRKIEFAKSSLRPLQDFEKAARSWDEGLVEIFLCCPGSFVTVSGII